MTTHFGAWGTLPHNKRLLPFQIVDIHTMKCINNQVRKQENSEFHKFM